MDWSRRKRLNRAYLPAPTPRNDAPHSLQVKEVIVALKWEKIAEDDKSIEYGSNPEPNNPNGPYMLPNHESSDDSDSD